MFDFHKPDWLYEALPYVYVLAGITVISNLGSVLSLVSGVLLISAGIYIWLMRRSYRKTQKRRAADRRAADRRAADRRTADWVETDRLAKQRREAERRDVERRDAERRRHGH